MEGGLSVVRVQVVGERRPAALLSSEAMEKVSVALILGLEPIPSGVTEPISSNWGGPDPLLAYPLRLPPADAWIVSASEVGEIDSVSRTIREALVGRVAERPTQEPTDWL